MASLKIFSQLAYTKFPPRTQAKKFALSKIVSCSLAMALLSLQGCGGGGGGDGESTVVPFKVEAVTKSGTIFNASPVPLSAQNYSEKEFFISGKANRYRFTDALNNATLIDSGNPYKTRVFVRAPINASAFNGTVIVEWLNVTTGQDIDFIFAGTHATLMKEGYAYVGVTAQRTGIAALAKAQPDRYMGLSLDAPNTDPVDGKILDLGSSSSLGGDVLSWDVFSQVAAAVRSNAGSMLPGLSVKKVIAAGESQSAGKLTTYYNSIQPMSAAYEGFLYYDRAGTLRTDLNVKALSIGTTFFNAVFGAPPADSTNHRWWELAGASHVSLGEMDYIDTSTRRDGILKNSGGVAIGLTEAVLAGSCSSVPIWSRVPNWAALSGSLTALNQWVTNGILPPTVPRLVVGSNNKVATDTLGRVSGGLRTAAYDVPMATNSGTNSGGGFCVLSGYHQDFTPSQMCAKYGSAANYRGQVRTAVVQNLADKVLNQVDGDRQIAEAASVDFTCTN